MKTAFLSLLTAATTIIATPAFADGGYHHGYRYHHRHGPVVVYRDNWVAPLVGGVVLGAIIADANAKEKEKEVKQVIVQPAPVTTITKVVVCSEWKEIMTSDGTVYRERTCKEQ
jgi:hypothetical protein